MLWASFLSTGDNYSPGNYGMWDQQRAIEFVKENIQAFRGNPSMITIFGQSTGGASVGLHILSPRSANLFQQAIMMSGSDRCEWTYIPSTDYVKQYAKELGDQLGCPTNDNQRLITCLQVSRSADDIVNASARVRIKQGTVGNPWGPVVDGAFIGANEAFLPDAPKVMREQGRFQKIRVMGGLVSDEGSFYIPKLSSLESGVTPAQYENIVNEFLWDRKIIDMLNTKEALEFQYTYWPQPENYTMIRQELINMMSDYIFGSGMEDALKYQTLYNRTFFYVFDFRSRFDFLPPWRGVAHGQELQYVFGFPYVNETYNRLFGIYPRQEYDIDYSDRNISDYMMNLFTNFSDSGNPTALQYEKKYFRNTTWLEYNVYNHSYLYIGNKSENRINYRQQYFAFWREYFVQLSNRPSYFTTAAPSSQRASSFETATWSLTALAGLLVIITIALFIVICRRRPKDY
ncbi:hypothetical protein ACJMK2_003869 [Sinanodonta woodiana]|uniref:Carboxylic ester hydrolase n=1 Tax=Sinanodonta woodiana TaxID=1069815 RepID=A0ABD3XZG4_SINWO